MQQLSGLDGLFIHSERADTPMHIASLLVYEPKKSRKRIDRFESVRDAFARRLHKSPVFRRKLLKVPLDMEQPWWVEDEHFDLDRHLQKISLPRNSTRDDLNRLLGELHAQSLDMSRPLWEAWYIGGIDQLPEYPRGAYGLYVKAHHAALDGVSGAEIIGALNELSEDEAQPPEDNWTPSEKAPSKWTLGWQAYFRSVRQPWRLVQSINELRPTISALRQREPAPDEDRLHWIRTPLNQQVGATRVIETIEVPLDALRRVRRRLPHTTMNHVVLTAVGGAMRRYLMLRDELPEHSLAAAIPVNVRRSDDPTAGNRVNIMMSTLHSDIEDPLQRLQAVRDAALRARNGAQELGPDLVQRFTQMMSPRIARLGVSLLHHAAGIAQTLPLPVHTIVSNIPGPPIPLYQNGAKLIDLKVFGLVIDAIGVFHALVSYDGRVNLSVLGCERTLQDPTLYRDCLQASFAELFELADQTETANRAA